MMAPLAVSVEDYLANEQGAGERHEFIDGAIYAMVGGTDMHNYVVCGLYVQFRSQLKTPCRAYMLDMKLRIEKSGSTIFYYPDLMVTCADRDKNSPLCNPEPSVLAELLSPPTECIDRT